MSNLSYNERSWAVDVISAVNQLSGVKKLEIRRAGGEHSPSHMDARDRVSMDSHGRALQTNGAISMTEKVLAALDAITTHVFGYRPKGKGLAAKKTERWLKRQAKKGAHDDRESSI